jgi:diguanylate cyclase (GGDEF)-like protein/PAS domain S-box-containing protein
MPMGLLELSTINSVRAMPHSASTSLLVPRQEAWLQRYVRFSLVVVWLMIVLQTIAYLIIPLKSLISGGLWIAAYGLVLIWGRNALQQGQLYRVADVLTGALLVISIGAGMTNPEALPILLQLPVIASVAVLPFVNARRFWVILLLSALAIIAIGVINLIQPDMPAVASVRLNVLLITGLETILILAMLVYYQRWLSELLEAGQAANLELVAAKATLEYEVLLRTTELHEREQKYRRLFEESLDVIYVTTPDGHLVDVNKAGLALFGYTREEFDQLDMARDIYVDPAERKLFQTLIEEHGIVRNLETRRKHKDGRILYVEESASAIRDEQGSIIGYQGFLADITARKQAEAALEASQALLRHQIDVLEQRTREATLLNKMGEWLQACQSVNEACNVAANTLQELVIGMSGAIYLRVSETNYFRCEQSWGRPTLYKQELIDDEVLADQLLGAALNVPIRNDGRVIGLVLLHGDMNPLSATSLLEMQATLGMIVRPFELAVTNLYLRETLQYQAIRDSLTGLFNRRYMAESLERELHRMERHQAPLSIVMLDIDYFKKINDQFGHAVGDVVLHTVGQFLLAHVRAEDIACRYGGEEFMLILPDSTLENTRRRAEQIREQTRDLVVVHNLVRLHFTVSIGIACFPIHGRTTSELLLQADLALYQAKALGRDQVAVAPTNTLNS